MDNCTKIWEALATNGVDRVAYLPCNKLNALMKRTPPEIDVWHITRESIGLGLCFGRSLAGRRSAMMIQNTGLGNLITELYTLQKLYQEALPLFVSWRGYYREPIEAQVIFGGKIEALLDAIDVEYRVLKTAKDVDQVEAEIMDEARFGKDPSHLLEHINRMRTLMGLGWMRRMLRAAADEARERGYRRIDIEQIVNIDPFAEG